jgi:hypothetical protein
VVKAFCDFAMKLLHIFGFWIVVALVFCLAEQAGAISAGFSAGYFFPTGECKSFLGVGWRAGGELTVPLPKGFFAQGKLFLIRGKNNANTAYNIVPIIIGGGYNCRLSRWFSLGLEGFGGVYRSARAIGLGEPTTNYGGGGAVSFNVNYLNSGPFFLSLIMDYQYISTPKGQFAHLSGTCISLKLGYNL